MNKLTSQPSNCRTAKSVTTRHIGSARRSIIAWLSPRLILSYTNDVARAAESCQAPSQAKTGAAE